MWSHYCEAHTGVCMYYEIPANYFWDRYPERSESSGKLDGFHFVGGCEVFYGNDSFTKWLTTGDLNYPIPDCHITSAATRIFSSKSKDWAYEEEWRIVTSRPGSLRFDPLFLKGVTFGINTIDENKTRISQIAKRHNPNVWFQQAGRANTTDFGLEIIEI